MVYLAMTAAELRNCESIPTNIAWMACHFSPYGTGLTNLPTKLPSGSLLILNDRTPVHAHNPRQIFDQLSKAIDEQQCKALLLDFQRPGFSETADIIQSLLELSCPVIVSKCYAEHLDCPIFLPPVPVDTEPQQYLKPYQDREIWLEAALNGLRITVTENGASFAPTLHGENLKAIHYDADLICHYSIDVTAQKATFTLHRIRDDLDTLLAQGQKYGVAHAVGLWQELGNIHYL